MSIEIINRMKIAGVEEDMRQWEPLCTWVGMCDGEANVANRLAAPQRVDAESPYEPASPHLGGCLLWFRCGLSTRVHVLEV